MILPPFDPPLLADLSRYLRSCTYADVHLLVLEVLHQRVTFQELAASGRDATRELGGGAEGSRSFRQMNRQINTEVSRAGALFDARIAIAPFSDDWLIREAVRCNLRGEPDEPDPGAAKTQPLPEFERVTWRDLRAAWHGIGRRRWGEMSIGQRLALETIYTRRLLRRLAKLARAAESAHREAEDIRLLRKVIESAMEQS